MFLYACNYTGIYFWIVQILVRYVRLYGLIIHEFKLMDYLPYWRTVKMHISYKNRIYPTALDWLQSIKQIFINVSYNILVASLTLMALF